MSSQAPAVGDIIKSFDFPGIEDSYIIGEVTKVEGDFIHAKTLKHVVAGEARRDLSESFKTPKMGCALFDSKFERIVVLG